MEIERLCFSAERDPAFARTPAQPRLPPPVLGRDGKITFPPCAGFGDRPPQAQHAPLQHSAGRMHFLPASGQVAAQNPPAPAARPTVQVDLPAQAGQQSGEERQHPATPQTPVTPQTPTTPTTPTTPGEQGGQGWKFGIAADGQQAEHAPRSPEMAPPATDDVSAQANGNDDAAAFAPGTDDAASFAPGMDDDVGNFAPGADYAAASSSYAAASSGYSADADAYAPVASPQYGSPQYGGEEGGNDAKDKQDDDDEEYQPGVSPRADRPELAPPREVPADSKQADAAGETAGAYVPGSSPTAPPHMSGSSAGAGSSPPKQVAPKSPEYQPSSPVYAPTSPVYAPDSGDGTRSEEGAAGSKFVGQQSSPVYTPSSPVYAPSSPTSAPPSFAPLAEGGEGSEGRSGGGLSFAEKMMKKMGYVEGKGLGKLQQGRVEAVDVVDKQDRAGLGTKVKSEHTRLIGQLAGKYQALGTLDAVLEMEVDVPWIAWDGAPLGSLQDLKTGMTVADVANMDSLHDSEASPTADYRLLASDALANDIKRAKSAFDDMERKMMRDAVQRANPWELVSTRGHHIFQNRAAMKMAEMDWLFNLTHRKFSNVQPDAGAATRHDNLFYFADICAGPGGFTEYVYWRRQTSARGWGFTLRGDHDFRLDKFNSTSPHWSFTPSYGVDDSGDIYSRQNMEHFSNKVATDTGGRGVSLVMADGGDSVDGEFLKQEWLMRRLALCQCCLALQILRKGGNFVCKLFDIFTPFLSDLCFLMHQVFDKTSLCKPLTSRPANSERYLVCMGLKERRGGALADFLLHVNDALDRYPDPPSKNAPPTITTISRLAAGVPDAWVEYVKEHNLRIGKVQAQFLDETLKFYKDPQLNIDTQQAAVCKRLRGQWGIPETVQESRRVLADLGREHTPASEHAAKLGLPLMFRFDPATDVAPKITSATHAAGSQGVGAGILSGGRPVPSGPSGAAAGGGGAGVGGQRRPADGAGGGVPGGGGGKSSGGEGKAASVSSKKAVGPNLSDEAVMLAIQKRATAAQLVQEKAAAEERQREEKEREKRQKMAKASAGAGAGGGGARSGSKGSARHSSSAGASGKDGGKTAAGRGNEDPGKGDAGKEKEKDKDKAGERQKAKGKGKQEDAAEGKGEERGEEGSAQPGTPPTPPPDTPLEDVIRVSKKRARGAGDDGSAASLDKKKHKKDKKSKKDKERRERTSASPEASAGVVPKIKISLPKPP